MKDPKISNNFYLWEFVPPDIYDNYGKHSIWFVDTRIVLCVQFLRDYVGVPVYVNTWKTGPYNGQMYTHSGFRPPYSAVGSKLSQHRFGRGADVKVQGMTDAEEVRDIIRDNWPDFMKLGLSTIEKDTPTWAHMDGRPTNMEHLFEVNYYPV